jgi:hypothetical protein
LKSDGNIQRRLLGTKSGEGKLGGRVQPFARRPFLPLAILVRLHGLQAVILANRFVHASTMEQTWETSQPNGAAREPREAGQPGVDDFFFKRYMLRNNENCAVECDAQKKSLTPG